MNVIRGRRASMRFVVMVFTIAAILVVPRLLSSSPRRGAGLDRFISLGRISGSQYSTDRSIVELQQALRNDPHKFAPHIDLVYAYLQKVRETGDPSLYVKSEALLSQAAMIDSQHPDLFAAQAVLALARHEFASALSLGQQALALNPLAAHYYGIVADAQIELGMYDQALQNLQTMVDRRPDFNSFSRIAYARELHGDVEGAIEAMQRAVEARGPVPENTAWAYVQLGNLWFGTGDIKQAMQSYGFAQQTVRNYPPALAGEARVAAARGDLKRAAALYQQAFNRNPLPEYAIALGDVYAKLGDRQQAQHQYELVQAIDQLYVSSGVNNDLELAVFFADHDFDLPAALAKARAAYAARPSIHAADALAWTLYKSGQPREAQRYAAEALKLGTRDALKLFHAGMIAKALGDYSLATDYLQQALDLNPHFSLLYADLTMTTLEELHVKLTNEGEK